ncbi:hypothetical protein SAMD00019534_024110, partial [Acytostelium subglobosum LB1]|uniref:hypothetical protein n=1 Tax=Acytostelium subglobosum LB1 TaxID=1410327 RepID=UPI000644D28C
THTQHRYNMASTRTTTLTLTFVFVLMALVAQSNAFSFKVPAKVEECIFEEIEMDATFTVMFQVTHGGFNDIDFSIISPDNRVLYKGQRESEGTKVIKASFAGVYRFCFSNQMSSLTEKTISFALVLSGTSEIAEYAKKASESTNSRVLWWSIFEAFILVVMSLWQIYYLRRFFEVKRAV